MATSIILVRHGETEVNAAGKMHSQHDQEKLNAIGRKQIIQTAEKLKNLGVNGV